MFRNNTLEAATIKVVPDMSNFAVEMRLQLRGINFAPIGREIGEEIVRNMQNGLESLDLQTTTNDWMNSFANLITVGTFFRDKVVGPLNFSLGKKGTGFTALLGKIHPVTAAITVLIGAIAWLIERAIGFRNIWEGLKFVFQPVADAIRTVTDSIRIAVDAFFENEMVIRQLRSTVIDILGPFGLLLDRLGTLGRSSDAVQTAQESLKQAYDRQREAIDRVYEASQNLEEAQRRVEDSSRSVVMANRSVEDRYDALQRALENYEEGSREVIRAQEDLEFSIRDYERAQERATQATVDQKEAQRESVIAARESTQATNEVSEANKNLKFTQSSLEGKTGSVWNIIRFVITGAESSIGRNTDSIGKRCREMWNGVPEQTDGAWSSVNGIALARLSPLPVQMTGIGLRIIQGMIRGMRNRFSDLRTTAAELGRIISSRVQGVLKINSPSRVFMQIGESLCSGLIQGLNNGAADVIKAVCNIADAITDSFEASATASLDALYSGASAGVDVIGAGGMGRNFQLAGTGATGTGNTYMTFNTPVTGYHEVLAANRSMQRQAARRR